jgi:outer membrane protein TolC
MMLTVACCLPPVAAGAEEKGLAELYDLAKERDPVVGKASARLEAGKADQQIAWSALLPRINATATQRKFWHKVENYGPGSPEGSYDG